MAKYKLTDVFNKRDQLDRIDFSKIIKESADLEKQIMNSLDLPGFLEKADPIFEHIQQIKDSVDYITSQKKDLKDRFSRTIRMLERNSMIKSYDFYEKRFCKDGPPAITKYPKNATDPEYIKEAKGMLSDLTNWTYPGLEIGPGLGTWTRDLIACDPLYIVDVHESFLEKTKSQFNELYQRRLRPYVIEETDLSCLPQGQIGLAFAWNVFEFLPYEIIKDYLKSVNSVLAPGGYFMFSYNNCEMYASSDLAERGLRCYMTRTKMVSLTEGTGYRIIKFVDRKPHLSYVIIQKTGSDRVEHNRAGQTVGKIEKD